MVYNYNHIYRSRERNPEQTEDGITILIAHMGSSPGAFASTADKVEP